MYQKIWTVILIFILVIFQVSFLPNFFSNDEIPDLILVVLIFWTMKVGFEKTWKEAMLAGFFLDVLNFSPLGSNALSFLIVIFLVSFLNRKFILIHRSWKFLVLAILIIFGTIINDLALGLIFKTIEIFKRIDLGAFPIFYYELAYKAAFNLLIFIIIYLPLKKFEKFLDFYNQKISPKNHA